MIDRPLDKYLNRRPEDGDQNHTDLDHGSRGDDATDDLGCFGWLRGVRDRALMLELRRKDGSIAAFPYAYIERIDFDPSQGITLQIMGKHVRIKGRNLNGESRPEVRLFNGITRHRVPWIQEHASRMDSGPEGSPTVGSIEW
jgi:hypothetical protein